MDLFWNHLRMLWSKAIRKARQWPPPLTPRKVKLLWSSHYSGNLESQMSTHSVRANSGWFWGGIRWRTVCFTICEIFSNHTTKSPRTGKVKICRYRLAMELCSETPWQNLSPVCKNYISDLWLKLGHPMPKKLQLSPHKCKTVNYGSRIQMTQKEDASKLLNEAGIRRVQQVVGALLWVGRAVNNKLIVALRAIVSQQASATR